MSDTTTLEAGCDRCFHLLAHQNGVYWCANARCPYWGVSLAERYPSDPKWAVPERVPASETPPEPLDDESLAFYDKIAPRCYIPDVEKTPQQRASDLAWAGSGFVPLLKEVHRLRATVAALRAEVDRLTTIKDAATAYLTARDALDARPFLGTRQSHLDTFDRALNQLRAALAPSLAAETKHE